MHAIGREVEFYENVKHAGQKAGVGGAREEKITSFGV
jgi:hypothetical protein